MGAISVIGLGKLGCTMAACFAHKGWDVIGVDILEDIVNKVNSGISPICEPRVQSLITDNSSRLEATTNTIEAVLASDISFIIVPTPSKPDGSFSTKYVKEAIKEIAIAIKEKDNHLIVVTSTVLPGDMIEMQEILENVSRKTCGVDFGLCYNPDFIAIGRIVHDFLNPDMVLIGQSDPASGQRLQEIHERLVDNKPEFHRMNYYNAELAKITLNSYCTMKITFANTIAEICENMPGGDSREVLAAVGADSRVGKKYFKGGLAYSGPCFLRDCRAFSHAADRYNVKTSLAYTTDMLNDYHRLYRITRFLDKIIKEKRIYKIAMLGLTYKEDTHLIEGSAPFHIMEGLAQQGTKVAAYDPMGIPDAKRLLRDKRNITFVESVAKCLEGQMICFVGTPWDEFRLLKKEDFLFHMSPDPVIIDAWDLYSFDDIEIIRLGKSR